MFILDPDPIFFPFWNPYPGVKKAPDPGSGSATLKNIFTTGNRSKNIPTKVQKPFWNAGNQVYLFILVNFYFLCSRIQVRILNTDPDPWQPNECGSGSTTLLLEHVQGEWGNPKCIIAQRWKQLFFQESSLKSSFSTLGDPSRLPAAFHFPFCQTVSKKWPFLWTDILLEEFVE